MLKIPNQERSCCLRTRAIPTTARKSAQTIGARKMQIQNPGRGAQFFLLVHAPAPAGVCFRANRRRQWIRDTEIAQALIARFAKRRNYSRGNPAVARTGGCESGERRERQQSRKAKAGPGSIRCIVTHPCERRVL